MSYFSDLSRFYLPSYPDQPFVDTIRTTKGVMSPSDIQHLPRDQFFRLNEIDVEVQEDCATVKELFLLFDEMPSAMQDEVTKALENRRALDTSTPDWPSKVPDLDARLDFWIAWRDWSDRMRNALVQKANRDNCLLYRSE